VRLIAGDLYPDGKSMHEQRKMPYNKPPHKEKESEVPLAKYRTFIFITEYKRYCFQILGV
jgi:hypothetical protein